MFCKIDNSFVQAVGNDPWDRAGRSSTDYICDLWFCYDNTSIKTTCKVKDKLHLHFDKVVDFITVEALYPRTNRQLNLEAFVIVHIFL